MGFNSGFKGLKNRKSALYGYHIVVSENQYISDWTICCIVMKFGIGIVDDGS